LLVAVQLGLLALMGWRALDSPFPFGILAAALLGGSAALALCAIAANRPGNFNIRPTPRLGGMLVTCGP
jgi:hypothetical protein